MGSSDGSETPVKDEQCTLPTVHTSAGSSSSISRTSSDNIIEHSLSDQNSRQLSDFNRDNSRNMNEAVSKRTLAEYSERKNRIKDIRKKFNDIYHQLSLKSAREVTPLRNKIINISSLNQPSEKNEQKAEDCLNNIEKYKK
ncbi:hypothetical protein [unidentified bacterial endosymbiont]|uniref:hypothetical protein n=1 Tax=unidentified bacterial endosymbiont TaxID=2355 RepID=UPI0020A16B3C|nr:hypothetical protein [unidentified bacterial endosymbiont]